MLDWTTVPQLRERKAHTREWKFYMVWLRFGGELGSAFSVGFCSEYSAVSGFVLDS
jgi:hypothetical protein